jgi:hypothetical protein
MAQKGAFFALLPETVEDQCHANPSSLQPCVMSDNRSDKPTRPSATTDKCSCKWKVYQIQIRVLLRCFVARETHQGVSGR